MQKDKSMGVANTPLNTPLFFGYSQRLTRNRPIFILMNLDHYKKKLIKSMRGANTPLSNTQQDKPTSKILYIKVGFILIK